MSLFNISLISLFHFILYVHIFHKKPDVCESVCILILSRTVRNNYDLSGPWKSFHDYKIGVGLINLVLTIPLPGTSPRLKTDKQSHPNSW